MPDYYPETSVVLLNQLSDLTSNENVRRAMGLVIDRNAIAELLGSPDASGGRGAGDLGHPQHNGRPVPVISARCGQ